MKRTLTLLTAMSLGVLMVCSAAMADGADKTKSVKHHAKKHHLIHHAKKSTKTVKAKVSTATKPAKATRAAKVDKPMKATKAK